MEYIKKLGNTVGILGVAAIAAVGVKLVFFYRLMGVQSSFVLIWAITAIFIALLFSSFRNKWIPAVIFLIFSVLMFADAAYASFFNRYLSVNMLGAAGFLGDIGASLKAVLKPKFFLLFLDNVLIFAALIERSVARKRSVESGSAVSNELEACTGFPRQSAETQEPFAREGGESTEVSTYE